MKQTWFGIIILLLCTSCANRQSSTQYAAADLGTHGAASDDPVVAPGKFIPTFAIHYGKLKDWPSLAETARFDLIDTGSQSVSDDSTWRKLKKLNPHLKVFVYELGPGEYRSGPKRNLPDAWDWITENHGRESSDRWAAVGATYGDYLQGREYPKERLMVIGNPAWQQYWLVGLFNCFWSPKSPNLDTDGIYADNTDYQPPSESGWAREGHPKQLDVSTDYYRNGVYQPDLWKAQAKAFLAKAVPWLMDRRCQLVLNFGYMARDPQSWQDLDSQPHPVFAAMEEGAFVHPWGGDGKFDFYSEDKWLNQVNAMRGLKNVRALMLIHGPLPPKMHGLARMYSTDAVWGNSGWDVLWFGLTSFLQGYDDVRQNAYLGFTVWRYTRAYWFDEFDPAHLNLGRAVGESHRVDGAIGHCYMREFEAGWAVVNPTDTAAQEVPVPGGQARILDHYVFENSEAQPLVTHFDLPVHRGIILLKPGRRAGNMDRGSAASSKGP